MELDTSDQQSHHHTNRQTQEIFFTVLCYFIVLFSLSAKLIIKVWPPGQCHKHSVPSETGVANSNAYGSQTSNGNEYTGKIVR